MVVRPTSTAQEGSSACDGRALERARRRWSKQCGGRAKRANRSRRGGAAVTTAERARLYASITFCVKGMEGVCVFVARASVATGALRETAPIVAHAFECLSDACLVSKGDNGGRWCAVRCVVVGNGTQRMHTRIAVDTGAGEKRQKCDIRQSWWRYRSGLKRVVVVFSHR